MEKKERLGIYLKDAATKTRIKIAAAKRGVSTTAYCADAIEERLNKDGELSEEEKKRRLALLSRMDKLSKEIGPIGVPVSELIKEGRRGRWYRETK